MPHTAETPPEIAVAVPARNEAARLPACLAALADQRDVPMAGIVVVVFANNCSDGTAEIARALAPSLPFRLDVVDAVLPPGRAHAGGARRAAMRFAAGRVSPTGGVLLCTDADGRPEPGWLAANLAALDRGVVAVAGGIRADPAELAALPAPLRQREAAEAAYGLLLQEIAARLDPVAHDPWPRHGMHSGASIAIRADAFKAIGGMPEIALGEDRALFATLARFDMPVRHAPDARVLVSCRLAGRSAGGMADTLLRRLADPLAPLDETLEPAAVAVRRARVKRALRGAWQRHRAGAGVAATFGVDARTWRSVLLQPFFGLAWERLQAAAPSLAHWPVSGARLRWETARARTLLAGLRGDNACSPASAEAATAGLGRR